MLFEDKKRHLEVLNEQMTSWTGYCMFMVDNSLGDGNGGGHTLISDVKAGSCSARQSKQGVCE